MAEPPPRVSQVLGLATGIVCVASCVVVQVLSRQSFTSAFRLLWGVVGLAGLVLVIFWGRLLRRSRSSRRD